MVATYVSSLPQRRVATWRNDTLSCGTGRHNDHHSVTGMEIHSHGLRLVVVYRSTTCPSDTRSSISWISSKNSINLHPIRTRSTAVEFSTKVTGTFAGNFIYRKFLHCWLVSYHWQVGSFTYASLRGCTFTKSHRGFSWDFQSLHPMHNLEFRKLWVRTVMGSKAEILNA